MVNIKNENELIENGELRTQLMERVDVLEKVKEIITLPNTELFTTKMVAEYYEVDSSIIRKTIERNRDELSQNGMKMMSYNEIKQILNSDNMSHLKISRQGTNIFSMRALLNVGMLLRDSKIAQEVRTQLLNGFEQLTTEQRVKEINREDELMLAVMKATNPVEQMIAISEYNNYHNRHKAELNARIEEMKPKEESFDTFINSKGNQKMNQVAKVLGIGRNKLFEFLREKEILMKDNTPYQRFIDSGYFIVKENTIVRDEFTKPYAQTFVTPKGVDYISKKLNELKLIK